MASIKDESVLSPKASTFTTNTFLLLKCVPYIYYPIQFKKYQSKIQILINSNNEINIMTSIYTKKLNLQTRKTNVKVQKIDGFTLETFGIALTGFHVSHRLGRTCFFQKTFWLVDNNINVILKILFLTLSNIDITFADWKLT